MYIVLFDIDGTLLQSGGAGSASFFETFQQDFGVSDIPGNISFAGRSDRAIAEQIMRACQIEATADAWQRFCAGYCRRLPRWLHACEGAILPGVSALLDTLEQLEHVALGLLTGNTERGAKMKLAHYGIIDRFAFGGYGHSRTDRNDIAADARKAAVQYASAQGIAALRGVMVIGDTPKDVLCARSIDAFAVAVATGGSAREKLCAAGPDLLLDDLTDTDALVAEVRAPVAQPGRQDPSFE